MDLANFSDSFTFQLNSSCNSFKRNIIFTSWFCVYVLFLPIFLFVLYVIYKKWQKHSSTRTHSDVFTLHMVLMEMTGTLAASLCIHGAFANVGITLQIGTTLISLIIVGQMFFHCLTCVERYLAVVHPITYLRLKKRDGVIIRNVSIGVTWSCSLLHAQLRNYSLIYLVLGCIFSFSAIMIVSYCSASVLSILIRPGPGDRKTTDQSKRSAFYTMVTILGALSLRFSVLIVYYGVSLSKLWIVDTCVMSVSVFWFQLPCSLVLPLLFLHRARKLPHCKTKKTS